MDKRQRRNEFCIINQPVCDFVFSSQRSCFIAYGYEESSMEKNIITAILKEKGIEPIDTSSIMAPAQDVFCSKICSRIITSQFCIVLLNYKELNGKKLFNPNINLEYGLMLGFNKYIIPFQKESQSLPFNYSTLDTAKYNDQNFPEIAKKWIENVIYESSQSLPKGLDIDEILKIFLFTKKIIKSPLSDQGDINLYNLGAPIGFHLFNDFSGMIYIYFGNFTHLRVENINWNIKLLEQLLHERFSALPQKQVFMGIPDDAIKLLKYLYEKIEIWVLVNSTQDKNKLLDLLKGQEVQHKIEIICVDDVFVALKELTKLE